MILKYLMPLRYINQYPKGWPPGSVHRGARYGYWPPLWGRAGFHGFPLELPMGPRLVDGDFILPVVQVPTGLDDDLVIDLPFQVVETFIGLIV